MANLVILYSDVFRLEDALVLQESILETRKRVLGEDHPNTLRHMANLTSSYSAMGRTSDALPLMESTLKVRNLVLRD